MPQHYHSPIEPYSTSGTLSPLSPLACLPRLILPQHSPTTALLNLTPSCEEDKEEEEEDEEEEEKEEEEK